MKVLFYCGKSGQAEKILVQDKNKRLYTAYCYIGNPSQDFVVDEKGYLIDNIKLNCKIRIVARNYLIKRKYG